MQIFATLTSNISYTSIATPQLHKLFFAVLDKTTAWVITLSSFIAEQLEYLTYGLNNRTLVLFALTKAQIPPLNSQNG